MKLNKKKILFVLSGVATYLVVVHLLIANSFGATAVPYNRTVEGVLMRMDEEEVIPAEVTFKGEFSNPKIGKSRFRGELVYENKSYTQRITISDDEGIPIFDQDDYTGPNAELGQLHTDENMDSIVIYILEYNDDYTKGWSRESGLNFVGGVTTKEEAIKVFDK
jgi:hypothetical protein